MFVEIIKKNGYGVIVGPNDKMYFITTDYVRFLTEYKRMIQVAF